jgi:hypothetical protein
MWNTYTSEGSIVRIIVNKEPRNRSSSSILTNRLAYLTGYKVNHWMFQKCLKHTSKSERMVLLGYQIEGRGFIFYRKDRKAASKRK